jgi:hypothetical protein
MKGGGRMSGNGRDMIRVDAYTRVQPQTDMETRIHQLEQEAYCFVLRAFKAQSDAITWVYTPSCVTLYIVTVDHFTHL